jgi:hypothetical protein
LRADFIEPDAATRRLAIISKRTFDRVRTAVFPVLTRKSVLMQRLLDNITRGYWHHTSGTVSVQRALPMVEKFSDRYGIADGKDKRYRRRKLGGGNATLLLAPTDNPGVLKWFLLVTEGEHLAHREESLRDARAKAGRIVVDGFELVELSRSADKGGGVRWTWRMTEEKVDGWRASIRAAARSSTVKVRMPTVLRQLFSVPGFGRTRQQVGTLTRYARGELERANVAGAQEMVPRSLGYVRRLPTEGVPLRRWCRESLKELQNVE